jgi:hypothetical protein
MTSWRDSIEVHPAAELFPRMGADELKALGEDILQNGMTSPIVLWVPKEYYGTCEASKRFNFTKSLLIDGRNRLDAMELVGMNPSRSEIGKTIVAVFFYEPSSHLPKRKRQETLADPYAYVASANFHRRHLTNAQKGELIEALLKAKPERSDRATAKIAQVDHKTVAAVRKEGEARGEIPHVERRDDTKGRLQPAHKLPPRTTPSNPAEVSPPLTIEEIAEALDVSVGDVIKAGELQRSGRTDLIEAARKGEMSLDAALERVARPEAQGTSTPVDPEIADLAEQITSKAPASASEAYDPLSLLKKCFMELSLKDRFMFREWVNAVREANLQSAEILH